MWRTTCHTLHGVGVAWLRKAKLADTFLKTSDDSGVTGVACDYCFTGDPVEGDAMNERCLLVLVHKFYGDRCVTERVVPRRGREDYAVQATAEDFEQSGMCRCLHKSDCEDAIKSLKQHAVQKRELGQLT